MSCAAAFTIAGSASTACPAPKRYAGNDDEYAELTHRHLTVLAELLTRDRDGDGDGDECEILAVPASWSGGPQPAPREAGLSEVMPAAAYWSSVLTGDSEPGAQTWMHPWVSVTRLHSKKLRQLLRLVAGYETAGVIVTTASMGWLYAPYDGGADVIAATAGHQDQLRRAYQDWLSAHPAGL
jgi:hypothetical protein